MVLQQGTDVRIWGESTPGAQVDISPSWSGLVYSTITDSNGLFDTKIHTPVGSYEAYTITITDGNPVVLENVLIGEVWLASGQSNMEIPLNGYTNCPIRKAAYLIADAANHPNIRGVSIEHTVQLTPQPYARGRWQVPTPNTAQWFSAAGYQYALYLERVLNVPVGIIACAWGGSRIEGWLPREILETYPDENLSTAADPDFQEYYKPLIMYNALLFPTSKYTIKGFLWYQGESNQDKPDTYAERLVTLVSHWRSLWGLGDIPFYFVELAPYNYWMNGPSAGIFREVQFKAQFLIKNSGIICTNDLVKDFEINQIHFANKKGIAKRLAYLALEKTYHIQGISGQSPYLSNYYVNGNSVILSFNNAEGGFSPWVGIKGFHVAGDDHKFYDADAVILDDGTISVSSVQVSQPVAVRYCFRDFELGSIYNSRHLPLFPFRTDTWNPWEQLSTVLVDGKLPSIYTPSFLKALAPTYQ